MLVLSFFDGSTVGPGSVCLGQPRVHRNPIHLPRFPTIIGEGLLKTAGIEGDVGYNKSDKDDSAVQRFVVEELAAPVLELPNRGLT